MASASGAAGASTTTKYTTANLTAAEKGLSASAQAAIVAAKNAYAAAQAKGDTAGMAAANAQANAIRSSNNLTTSATGADVVAKSTTGSTTTSPTATVKPTSTASSGNSGQMTSSWSSTGTGSSQTSYPSSTGTTSGSGSSAAGSSSYYTTGRVVNEAANGDAPAGTQIGDTVHTAGGDFLVVAPNTAGASYNPSSGLWSIKLSSAGNTGTTGSSGYYSTGKVVNEAANGDAPAGTQIGDTVHTAGGDFLVVAPGTAGASYNPSSGLWSIKLSSGGTTAAPSTTPAAYTPQGTYMDAGLSVYDDPRVKALQAYYESRKAAGATQAELNSIHQQAEDIRSAYGYSGGNDGSMYIPLELPQDTLPQIGLPVYEPQVEQVDTLYNAAQQRALAALQSAYDQSRLELERYQSQIPGIYQQQANALAAQQAMQQRQYNEYAAQSGLNTGNSAQARLAMANQMQQNMGQIRTAEANATADAQYQLTQLFTQYQNSIAEALANNEYERAAALLAEYKERAQSVVSVAQNQANLDVTIADFNRDTNQTNWQKQMALAEAMAAQGDFSGYRALGLSDDQINSMRRGWLAQNPEAAINMGLASYR